MYLFRFLNTDSVRKDCRNMYVFCPLGLLCAKSDFIKIQLLQRSEKKIKALTLYLCESREYPVHWTILFIQA